MQTSHWLILSDWGTSFCRFYLCQWQAGRLVVQERIKSRNIKKQSEFECLFFQLCQPWLDQYGTLPVYLTGAVGSNLGWKESPYLTCPASQEQVLDKAVVFHSRGIEFAVLPGLKCTNPLQMPDVMRGEETQVFGYLANQLANQANNGLASARQFLCLPGTHTKWVVTQDKQISTFLTSQVGELFDILSVHSVLLGQLDQDNWSQSGFAEGLSRAMHASNDLLHSLFATRTLQLTESMSAPEAKSYLSGLLIGADIKAACASFKGFDQVTVIGTQELCQLYQQGLSAAGMTADYLSGETATVKGFQAFSQNHLSCAV